MGIIHNSFALNFPKSHSPKFSQITTKMKFLLTTTFFAVALLQCAYAASDDNKEELGGLDKDEDEEQLSLVSGDDMDEQTKIHIQQKGSINVQPSQEYFRGRQDRR